MLQLLESILPQKAKETDHDFPFYLVDLKFESVNFLLSIIHTLSNYAVHQLSIRYFLALQDRFFLLHFDQRLDLSLVLFLILFALPVV